MFDRPGDPKFVGVFKLCWASKYSAKYEAVVGLLACCQWCRWCGSSDESQACTGADRRGGAGVTERSSEAPRDLCGRLAYGGPQDGDKGWLLCGVRRRDGGESSKMNRAETEGMSQDSQPGDD